MESWDWLTIEADELRDAGDRVFNGCGVRARGRGSGVEITMRTGTRRSRRPGCLDGFQARQSASFFPLPHSLKP